MSRPTLLFASLFLLVFQNLGAQDTFSFRGDNLTSVLTQGREKTVLRGHAQIESGDLVIKADEIELSGKNLRYAVCRGSVDVRDEKKNLTLKADKMDYDREKKISQFTGNTEIEDGKNALIVRSGFVDYHEKDERLTMQITVRIFKRNLTCRSESAFYDRKAETLELSGLPQVYKGTDEYRAGHIGVNLKTDEITLDANVSGSITPKKKEKKSDNKDKKDGQEPKNTDQPPVNEKDSSTPPPGPPPSEPVPSDTKGAVSP